MTFKNLSKDYPGLKTNRLIEWEPITGADVVYNDGKVKYVDACGLSAPALVKYIVENHDDYEIQHINVNYVYA